MKKVLILIIAISLFAVLSKAKAIINEYDEIAKSDKVGVILYAKKMNGLYTDFKIDFQGGHPFKTLLDKHNKSYLVSRNYL